jgi:hypothetical protein
VALGVGRPCVKKASLFLMLVLFGGILQPTIGCAAETATNSDSFAILADSDQSPPTAETQSQLTIPGPLRSFLRMSGMSQDVASPDALPILAHDMVLQGYLLGRPTEFLILLRRYVSQAKELTGLVGQEASIRVHGCKDAGALLGILGYAMEGACGQKTMRLVTAEPERAFLTVDSGFPLLDLEEALQSNAPFVYGYAGSNVPVMFRVEDWEAVVVKKGEEKRDLLGRLLYEPDFARLYWAMAQIEPATRDVLKKEIGLGKLQSFASLLDLYGSEICIRDGRVVVPGGRGAEKQWQEMVGANPGAPAEFITRLLIKDSGWMAAYFDAMARIRQSQQEHFAAGDRIKTFYAAFMSPGVAGEPATRLAFRPAPALMVLMSRMQWDASGDPYVPGSMQAWSEIIRAKGDSKLLQKWNKRGGELKRPDQLAEAMFVFTRLETDVGPVQAYLCLSELDHRRAPGKRLNNQTVLLLANKYRDFSDQYMIFSEFPELSEESITHFLSTAEGLSKLSEHTLRGNAMGVFQANVAMWQILARQGQIDHGQLNATWMELIKPFEGITNDAGLVTAGRQSVDQVFRAATGKASGSQDELINLLAGARQTNAEAQQIHKEMANKIRVVLDDQRLVSFDTLFTLDDGLKNLEQGTGNKEELVALAGELREFEMPRPIFTNSERDQWAAGTYNNHHTEQQMRTDLAKVIQSPASPKQLEAARGQLATFLRDTLVGMVYAYYEPPNSQVLHNNPLFVRSHDFSGETVIGVDRLWEAPRMFGEGSPAGGGAHLIGSLADLPFVLAEVEQDFIAPDHVQSLIWQQFVPGVMSNAIVPRWWNVSRKELHAVALYQRAGEEVLMASTGDEELRRKVLLVLSDRMPPERRAMLERTLQTGKATESMEEVAPADSFYLTAEMRQRFPKELENTSAAGRELETLSLEHANEVSWERLSRDFGVIHPVFMQTYAREFVNVRPFPALGGSYGRLMAECWDSGNLYWARLADEMGYSPVLLNRMVPQLTHRMIERIAASDLEDWPATLRALRETGEEVRQGKMALVAGVAPPAN